MKELIVIAAFGLAVVSAPVAAQSSGTTAPGASINSSAGGSTGLDSANTPGTVQRARPEIQQRRALDPQRGISPMTTDPRLGPPSASDSGGPAAGPRVDTRGGSRGPGSGGSLGR